MLADVVRSLARILPLSFLLSGALGATLGCIVYVDEHCEGVVCGESAYCDAGVCECVEGYRSEDPSLGCEPVQLWRVTDGCNDDADIEWRLFSQDRDWAWPEAAGNDGSIFRTNGLNNISDEKIVCQAGEMVCFGGESKTLEWGVGIHGEDACDSCCFECSAGFIDYGILECVRSGSLPKVIEIKNGEIH